MTSSSVGSFPHSSGPGGAGGPAGGFRREHPPAPPRQLDHKPSGVTVTPAQRIVVETPGAGGYGPPEARPAEALEDDRESGKFSAGYLRQHYGFPAK